jgi:hypothetical protein
VAGAHARWLFVHGLQIRPARAVEWFHIFAKLALGFADSAEASFDDRITDVAVISGEIEELVCNASGFFIDCMVVRGV